MGENYLIATVQYRERNPVSAGLSDFPEEWKWASAGAHGTGEDDTLVPVRPMLDRIDDWDGYLPNMFEQDRSDCIEQHTRTGRPSASNKGRPQLCWEGTHSLTDPEIS